MMFELGWMAGLQPRRDTDDGKRAEIMTMWFTEKFFHSMGLMPELTKLRAGRPKPTRTRPRTPIGAARATAPNREFLAAILDKTTPEERGWPARPPDKPS